MDIMNSGVAIDRAKNKMGSTDEQRLIEFKRSIEGCFEGIVLKDFF